MRTMRITVDLMDGLVTKNTRRKGASGEKEFCSKSDGTRSKESLGEVKKLRNKPDTKGQYGGGEKGKGCFIGKGGKMKKGGLVGKLAELS